MAKDFNFDPQDLQRPETLALGKIELNSYRRCIDEEKNRYGEPRLRRAYYWLQVIRNFENMLDALKKKGSYQGIDYSPKGPAHLAIGQETVYVGQALALQPDDQIYGSHRSHGEILAKTLAAIDQLDDQALLPILENYLGGKIWRLIEQHWPGTSVRDGAENFIIYGLLAEIFALKTGLNAGLGGSMHAFFAPFGSMPNNAIVGGSADIAVGAALYKLVRRRAGIVVANIGDGALACGPVWEALSIAAMDQYLELWPQQQRPPFLLCALNNFYAMGGQPVGETMGLRVAARLGAGVNPERMHAERVNGFDPLAVADAMNRKAALLKEGRGPALLEIITYRYSGHSPSDSMSYRSKEELEGFVDQDPIAGYADYLLTNKLLSAAEQQQLDQQAQAKITQALKLAVDPALVAYLDAGGIEKVMYSPPNHPRRIADQQGQPELLLPQADNPRIRQLQQKERYAFQENGQRFSPLKLYCYRDAIFEAIIDRFYHDPGLISYGEELRDWGGAFACYRGLTESLPYDRLFNAPIAEGAIVGTAIGYALNGGCALIELMYCDFIGRAGDQVFNQLPKWQAMSAGLLPMSVVLRISIGTKYGAQHSQDWSAICAHLPGLKVMYPATPYDAKGMLTAALADNNPVIFFESQKLYGIGEEFQCGGVPKDRYLIAEGQPDIKRVGRDLTLISLGPALYPAMAVAQQLQQRYQLDAEVVDLRFLNPLDYSILVESVKKTGRALLISDAVERGNFMHTVASQLSRLAFDYLDAPVIVHAARNWIAPPADLEELYFPQVGDLLDSIHENILPLNGHQCRSNQSGNELQRRYRQGV